MEISNAIAVIAMIFSLTSFVIAYQTGRKEVRSSTYSAIMGRLFELNRIELQEPKLFEHLHEEFSPAKIEKGGGGLSTYLFMLFNLYAEIYTQYRQYRRFDREEMRIWENRIENDFFYRPFLRGYWEARKQHLHNEYADGFLQFMDERVRTAGRRRKTTEGDVNQFE